MEKQLINYSYNKKAFDLIEGFFVSILFIFK